MTLIGNAPTAGGYPAFDPQMHAEGAHGAVMEAPALPEGRRALDSYFDARGEAEARKHDLTDEQLGNLQIDAYVWLQNNHHDLLEPGTVEDYAQYDEAKVTARLSGLAHHLRAQYPDAVTQAEVDATDAFIGSAFGVWEAKDKGPDENVLDGSFAFIVPPRVSRNTPEYGDELADLIHVLRYVPKNMRAAMLRGVPPWVVDQYQQDENGKNGYLICANVSGDLKEDLGHISTGTATKTARNMINDAVDLAVDGMGVWAVGYGATFPGVMRYGAENRRSDVITTTGHAGTVAQIAEGINSQYPDPSELTRLGVIGLGAIGAPAAEVLATLYPNAQVNVFDLNPAYTRKLAGRHPGRFEQSAGQRELIEESDVIVSAVTTAVELRKLGITSMDGKLVVDDSQPGAFNAAEAEALGGAVVWPIATDKNGIVRRKYCGYGDLMAHKLTDLFGCEAEVASLVRELYLLESMHVDRKVAMRMVGRMAITGPVTVEQVLATRERMEAHGIVASVPQSFGVERRIPVRPAQRSGFRPHTAPAAPMAA